jgi:xanthine dehydrogenase YagS FAD-binding subunit
VVEVEGPNGARDIALDALHALPGAAPERETTLQPGELILAVRLPAQSAAYASHTRYLKLRERTSYAFAVVSAAVALEISGDTICTARIALGGVAAKPWRARAAESALENVAPTPEAFAKAADLALDEASPSGDNAFKIALARNIVARALTLALAGTPRDMPALPASPFSATLGASHAG